MYIETDVYLSDNQKDKLRRCYAKEEECVLNIKKEKKPNHKLKLTETQINRIKQGKQIKISKTQINQNGGFIGALLPVIAKGALAGLASLAAQKVVKKVTGSGCNCNELMDLDGFLYELRELVKSSGGDINNKSVQMDIQNTAEKLFNSKKKGKGVLQNWE